MLSLSRLHGFRLITIQVTQFVNVLKKGKYLPRFLFVDDLQGKANVHDHEISDFGLRRMCQTDSLENAAKIHFGHQHFVLGERLNHFTRNSEAHVQIFLFSAIAALDHRQPVLLDSRPFTSTSPVCANRPRFPLSRQFPSQFVTTLRNHNCEAHACRSHCRSLGCCVCVVDPQDFEGTIVLKIEVRMFGIGELHRFQFLEYRRIWFLAIGFSILMHASSFWWAHTEGDELVYLALAHEMKWDLSHYTTRDDPTIRKFPDSIYRGPLFHQPPLLPLVLKLGQVTIGSAVDAGLLFENVAIWLLLYYTWRWMVFQRMPILWGSIALAGVTFCPLLLSSSTRLHHDALMACFMVSGLVAYIEALQRPGILRATIAGLLLSIGLNLRYNALIYLPILFVLQLDNVVRSGMQNTSSEPVPQKLPTSSASRWLAFGIVGGLVATVGLQHYYRVLANYGSLMPSSFLHLDPDAAEFSPFLRSVLERQPWKTALHLVLIYPILFAFALPAVYVPLLRRLREGSREVLFTPIFLYLFAVEFYFSYSQVRYFATVMPCLYLALPLMIRDQTSRYRTILGGLAALSLMLMFATGFGKTQATSPESMLIVPAPFFYLPPLMPLL